MSDLQQSDRRIQVNHVWRHVLSRILQAQLVVPYRDSDTCDSPHERGDFIFWRAAESGCLLMLGGGRIAKRPLCAAREVLS